ncbi:hypothetical protein AHMF7605_00515 [Adhaeribacter arboris]|uniref:Uncharacterized protein n=1 Tax=Adhaeribacter arboris TaxID=2072846 RepID=A0A2T2Y9K7_9BACT|nr:hypothetical protein [Adhaeribacter arboris]PSR52108.1 hypothetical protein AHMF7605_00515 [Adhaeribacter arboris]
MKKEQCPLCYSELEAIECAPCHDCGHLPIEIEHFKSGIHIYRIYDVYKGLRLQLCDFCTLDFGSYRSEYLGFDHNKRLGFDQFNFVQELTTPDLEKDKYCPDCAKRLKFLNFIHNLRELIEKEKTIANQT